MPSEAAFDRAILRIEEYVGRIGDTVVEPIVDRDDNDRTVGFVVERGSYKYRITGDPDVEFFHVEFPFDIVTQLAGLISEERAREMLTEEEVDLADVDVDIDPGEDPARRVAVAALDGVGEENREAFAYHLVLVLSSGRAAYSLRNTEAGMVSGFTVSTKVFPHEEEFSLTEFDRAVQSVVNTGIGGLIFVNQAFDFRSMIDAAGFSGVLPRYIH